MERYESKQVSINKPENVIYTVVSEFSNFTPILGDKVDGWMADSDSCSFKVQGFAVKLRIIERTPFNCIKIGGDEGSPFNFNFWVQLKQVGDNDTRMKLTLEIELNMMMRMMLGGKLSKGIDDMADKIAEAFNNTPL